ncbi:restriction endonuclease subunit S [Enterocloster lavalensis]|uniref:restriction endonuclease subunit S n=1 Tax=Enterocloster lavalensis TaxID=460384 RepID=UPI0023F4E4B4|nr:restriction endonuclease subunit S [Enterocloster lavalensis]
MAKPKLRFPEFTDEWEEHKFGNDIIEHTEKTSDKETYPLYSLTIEEGVIPKSERYEREFLINKEGDVYKIVPPSAFVYNPMNLRFGALKVNHEKFAVSVSGYYNIFSLRNPETLQFWENYLTTDKMLNLYFSIATGSLIEKLRVHFSQFVNIKKPLPSIEEQKKISKFLLSIDDAIQVQEKELAALEEQKKGIMQKLFNREVRFKRDDGSEYPEWNKEKWGSIGQFLKSGNLSKSDLSEEGTPCILYGELYTKYKEIANVIYSKTNTPCEVVSKKGDVIIPKSGETPEDISTATCIPYDGVALGGDLIIFRSDCILGLYLSYLIANKKKWEIAKIAQGKTIVHINEKSLAEIEIEVPCVEEQQKIADCLSAYDEAIQIKKDKLEVWKEIKKGLLQQMFV